MKVGEQVLLFLYQINVNEIISTDLSKVMDKISGQNDLRSGKGGISFLTNGVISRIDQTKEAFRWTRH